MEDEDKLTLIEIWTQLSDTDELDLLYNDNKSDIDIYLKQTRGDLKIACFLLLIHNDLIYNDENIIVNNESFISNLISNKDKLSDIALTLAIYETNSFVNNKHIKDVETSVINNYELNKHEKIILEETIKCPSIKEGKVYDEYNNEIPIDKLFEFRDKCYNIDDYLIEHEKIKDEIKYINAKNMNYNDDNLKSIYISDSIVSYDLSDNKLFNLNEFVFPYNVKEINLSNNPITEIKCTFNNNLESLVLSSTRIEHIDYSVLPIGLKYLDLSKCHSLKTLDLTFMNNLVTLDISDCILLRELILSDKMNNIKIIYAKNTYLNKVDINSCHKLELLDFEGGSIIPKITLNETNNIPVFVNTKCTTFRVIKSSLSEFIKGRIPPKTKNLVLVDNMNLIIKKNQIDNLSELISLVILSCPKITTLTSGMFNANVVNKNKQLSIACNYDIDFKPNSFFNVRKI